MAAKRMSQIALLFGVLLSCGVSAWGTTWYVDVSGPASGDGTSWETAFTTIGEGIAAAADGEEIIVAEGNYVENINFAGKNIVLRGTDPTDWAVVENTIIDGSGTGAAVTFAGTEDETCVLAGFTIRNGSAVDGGGIRGGTAANHAQATIQNNIITGNSAEDGSGLAYCDGLIAGNMILGNTADHDGGGLADCGGTIHSNVIAGNSAVRNGGGLYRCGGTIRNNTIYGNSAQYGGGVMSCQGEVSNCILWGNTATSGGPQIWDSYNFKYCCVEGGVGGEGNTKDGPLFVDPYGPDDDPQTYEDNDYHLWVGSVCIDAGRNEGWMSEVVDLDGNPRILQGRVSETVDIGAYEYVYNGPTAETWYVDGAVSGSRDGTTPETAFETIQEGINAASDAGDTVIVAEGTYVENVEMHGKRITLRSSDPSDWSVVRKTIIDGNQAGPTVVFAGTEDETCVLSGFMIRNGLATMGGGILGGTASHHSHATIEKNIIAGNSAEDGGGVVYFDGIIQSNVIYENTATHDGGGLVDCNGLIQSNVIAGNSAARNGGGLYRCGGTIRNNTIYGNSAQYGGGVMSCRGEVSNCILWGNTATSGGPQIWDSYNFEYCCVEGGVGGEGNIKDDPLFVDPYGPDDDPQTYEDNDYHLWVGSVCIDAGRNEGWMSEAVDLDGNPRILQGRVSETVDMGADEYVFNGPTEETWYVDGAVSGSGDGTTPETAFKTIQEAIIAASDAGDTVIVAQGTYMENVDFHGRNIILQSTNPTDWGVVRNTVIDGDGRGPAVTLSGTEDETCVLSGFTIRNGSAAEGGGIRGGTAGHHTQATIQNNIITGNSAEDGGGVAYCDGITQSNMIYENTANQDGGGLAYCDGIIQSNLVAGNSAVRNGGGLYRCGGIIRNNTIFGNAARYGGGVTSCGVAPIYNCILWGNMATSGGPQIWDSYNFKYCCVEGGVGGEGNIKDDPLFVDPYGPDDDPSTYDDNDLRLDVDSPCVDRGRTEEWMWQAFDLDHFPRILPRTSNWRVDMGAYEHTVWKPAMIRTEPGGDLEVIWISEPGNTYVVWSTLDLLSGEWKNEGTTSSVGSLTSWIEPDAASHPQKFYRIEIQ